MGLDRLDAKELGELGLVVANFLDEPLRVLGAHKELDGFLGLGAHDGEEPSDGSSTRPGAPSLGCGAGGETARPHARNRALSARRHAPLRRTGESPPQQGLPQLETRRTFISCADEVETRPHGDHTRTARIQGLPRTDFEGSPDADALSTLFSLPVTDKKGT
jgi:hypothetical protein